MQLTEKQIKEMFFSLGINNIRSIEPYLHINNYLTKDAIMLDVVGSPETEDGTTYYLVDISIYKYGGSDNAYLHVTSNGKVSSDGLIYTLSPDQNNNYFTNCLFCSGVQVESNVIDTFAFSQIMGWKIRT